VADGGSLERFGKAVIVNYLLLAPDAHAKNYSLLLVGSLVRLAPLYDVPRA
jgi:serine/threonine-protein kinase HipA